MKLWYVKLWFIAVISDISFQRILKFWLLLNIKYVDANVSCVNSLITGKHDNKYYMSTGLCMLQSQY